MIAPGSLASVLPNRAFKETIEFIRQMKVSDRFEAAFWTDRLIALESVLATRNAIAGWSAAAALGTTISLAMLAADIAMSALAGKIHHSQTVSKLEELGSDEKGKGVSIMRKLGAFIRPRSLPFTHVRGEPSGTSRSLRPRKWDIAEP